MTEGKHRMPVTTMSTEATARNVMVSRLLFARVAAANASRRGVLDFNPNLQGDVMLG